MNVVTKNFGGNPYTFRFGIGFIGDILDYIDGDMVALGEAMQKNPFKLLPAIMYYGYKNECEVEERSVDISMKTVNSWLEQKGSFMTDPDIIEIINTMTDSMQKFLPSPDDEGEDAEDKKK